MKILKPQQLIIYTIKLISTIILISIIIFCLLNNKLFIKTIIHSLNLWLYRVFPSIFTFYIITSILIKLNILNKLLIIFKPLSLILKFETSNAFYLFLIGILIGNPASANLIYTAKTNNTITNNDYNKLIHCSGFITPLFIFSLFPSNIKSSLIIFISHILSYFLMCIILNNKSNNKAVNINNNINLLSTTNIPNIFYKACEICLTIASIMVMANLIISSLESFNFNSYFLLPLELSTSIFNIINSKFNYSLIIIIISILTSFNCLSIHLQIFSQIKEIKYYKFLLTRVVASIISGIFSFILILLL